MPEHVYTVAALGHSVDTQTNNVTLFSILERIGVTDLPLRMPGFTVVTLWLRQPGDEGVSFAQRICLVDPDGGTVEAFENSFTFERPRQRIIGVLAGVPFEKTGIHRIEVYLRKTDDQSWGEHLAAYPIDVVVANRPSRGGLLPSEAT